MRKSTSRLEFEIQGTLLVILGTCTLNVAWSNNAREPHPARDVTSCTADMSSLLQVNARNPWRPPFGLDRIGAPQIERVAISGRGSSAGKYLLVGYRDGRETERHLLQKAAHRSAISEDVRFESFPQEVALFVSCGRGGTLRELTRKSVDGGDIEAEAVARPEHQINPVDLGTILVPYDWLLLAGGQTTQITVAAISHSRNIPQGRLRAWFDGGGPVVEIEFPLSPNQRAEKQFELPPSALRAERTALHVSLSDGVHEIWKKSIPTMRVPKPPRWPSFGAVELKLRYDAAISVRDPKTGVLSSTDYNSGWDAKRNDVVVFLPNGSRFVFWRGSNYIPFWAGLYNTGTCYEWAENQSQLVHHSDGTVDFPEPLFDTELRYGRVKILESSASRVHVRWTYQSTDIDYNVWGDEATEDYYFYPDGFGTRVLTLTSSPGADYELSEFIVITPQSAFPFDVLPKRMVDVLFLDGRKRNFEFPARPASDWTAGKLAKVDNPKQESMMYRIFGDKRDPSSAIYFSPHDSTTPYIYPPFDDRGQLVTPAYWGSHWPLSRGMWTAYSINDRIYVTPGHNSLMTWGAGNRRKPLSISESPMLDTLGRARTMTTQRWAWLIAKTDEPDDRLIAWARSYSDPPSIKVTGGRLDWPSYSPERRSMRLIAESPSMDITLVPKTGSINPVFELSFESSAKPWKLAAVTIDGVTLAPDSYAWDGAILWIRDTIGAAGAKFGFRFVE